MSRGAFRWGRPEAWWFPGFQTLSGPYAKNDVLAQLQRLESVSGTGGPESLAIAKDGTLYSGFDDGRIVQFTPDGAQIRVLAQTSGRPLGLRFHPGGDLLVCDASCGLLSISMAGQITVLADEAEGVPFGLTDDLDVDTQGRYIYFSDASSQWPLDLHHLDLIEHGGHGRLLCHDLHTGQTKVLMRGLQFANGVTLGPDDAYALVVEMGMYRVHRHWLKGDRAGQSEIWLDNLPGFPDNVRFNGRDRFWLAIPTPRNPMLDLLAPLPWLRFLIIQYARYLPIPIKHVSMVLAFDLNAKLVNNLQSHRKNGFHLITQAMEVGEWLYCSSLESPTLARMPIHEIDQQP